VQLPQEAAADQVYNPALQKGNLLGAAASRIEQ
jgi:hypothetical protein